MQNSKHKFQLSQSGRLQAAGILLLMLLAALLLWFNDIHSTQAVSAIAAKVRFYGTYRIGDGQWQEITEGQHIPATKGDVTLRGNFHMLAPDGEYIGIYRGKTPIALYSNHINLTIREGDNAPFVIDLENPLYGSSACGVYWSAYLLTSGSEEPIEILIHNPHNFGNENAIDEMLSNMAFWSGLDFEKGVLESGEFQRNAGLFFAIVALLVIGIALFSTLIRLDVSKIIWFAGLTILFAGVYFIAEASNTFIGKMHISMKTTLVVLSIMLYGFFMEAFTSLCFMKPLKKIGYSTVAVMGTSTGILLTYAAISNVKLYDIFAIWVALQIVSAIVLLIISCI